MSAWDATARLPITGVLRNIFTKKASRRSNPTAGYVDEQLCDELIKRLSPFLQRNAPIDILDLWPGCGVWSSKMNDFLRPRRHVLIEPNVPLYGSFLKKLAKTNPCYKVASGEIYGTDWPSVFERYLPEQIRHMDLTPGTLPKNDTLLILANPPTSDSKSTHYTPARWWASTMEDCMTQSGLHAYGSVRILAGISALEAQVVLPRSVHDRRRPAILTENVALHTFEVASGCEAEPWHTLKTWDSIHRNYKRVAERTAAQNIINLPEREIIPLKLAPEVPPSERKIETLPYRPRAETAGHRRSEKLIRRGQQVSTGKDLGRKEISEIKAEARKARAALNFDNQCVTAREEISNAKAAIDERMRALSRAAADPQKTADELMKLNEEIEAAISAVTKKIADTHFRHYRGWERNLDDARIEAWSNHLDDSVLLWDRRPFEPIRTHDDEIFPRYHQNLIYFEADENAISAQSLGKVPPEDRESLSALFEALTLSFSSGNHISIAELAERLFPGRASNEVVQSIPSLAYYVGKRVKPGCGPIPLADGSLDANKCFQENIDYHLSEVRVICLPPQVLWDILLEYHKHAIDYSPLQFNRLLGGTLTSYRTGDYRMDSLAKRLR